MNNFPCSKEIEAKLKAGISLRWNKFKRRHQYNAHLFPEHQHRNRIMKVFLTWLMELCLKKFLTLKQLFNQIYLPSLVLKLTQDLTISNKEGKADKNSK